MSKKNVEPVEYTYSESEEENIVNDENDEVSYEGHDETYQDFEPQNCDKPTPVNQALQKLKTKSRSDSFDLDGSDVKKPNFKCGSCKKSFLLEKSQKMIRCSYCGYRILFKLRTRNYITYKTE